MSFLLVSGKSFRCKICKHTIQVEYEGGPAMTQIGDFNVSQQLEYSKEFGQPNENPETDGYSLLDFGVCQECYQNNVFLKDQATEENKQKLLSGYDDLISKKYAFMEENLELFTKFISEKIETFSLDDINIIAGQDFDPDLGDKYASPKKKKGLFNAYFQQNIRGRVVPYFLKCAFNDPDISQIVSDHNQSSKKQWKELRKLFSKKIISIHVPTLISQAENLNDYIQCESTVRYPTKDTPNVNFYHQVEFSLDNDIKSDFLISKKDISSSIINEYVENALKEKILGMILK
jgi:hypothetical protein